VTRLDRLWTAVAAVFLALFGLLPIVNWIPGGHHAGWYGIVVDEWVSGSAIALGLAVVVALAARRAPTLGARHPLGALARSAASRPLAWAAGSTALAFALYAAVAHWVFDGRPLLIDEIIQLFQARTYAGGRLWLPVPGHPEFFSVMHLVEDAGKLYGQFPAGGPAMMVPMVLAGLEWLTGPLFGALSVVLFFRLARRVEPDPAVGVLAGVLFAFAPFTVFMSGSYMNHVTALTWILVGMLGLARATAEPGGRAADGFLAGLGFGVAATIRPVDAAAFALPAGLWLLVRAVRERRLGPLVASGLGIALPVAALLWANAQTTGAPLRFGYTVMWGKSHDLGFHATPWGEVHSPASGVQLLSLYFLRLETYLFESPLPSLLPAMVALGLTRRLGSFDRYLLAASALLCAAYFAYWHDGFYLGPRFMYPLLPLLALWTARAVPAVRARWPGDLAGRTAATALAIALAIGAWSAVTIRGREYRSGMQSPRWDADAAAAEAGVRNGLVLVRESWGAQVIAGMWQVGVPRSDAEEIYRRVDTCRLDLTIDTLVRSGVRGPTAVRRLQALLADSDRVAHTTLSPDPTERVEVGFRYPEVCHRRIDEDWHGFTLFPSLLLAGRNGNVFARDLQARDSLLLAAYPGRPVYLLRRATFRLSSPLRFERLDRDSLLRAWR
jgi:hypothetical protein